MFNALIGEGGFGLVLSGLFIRNKVREIMSSLSFLLLPYSSLLLPTIIHKVWYAVKGINKYELMQHKTGLQMIMGELEALRKLSHPFIVGLQSAYHDA